MLVSITLQFNKQLLTSMILSLVMETWNHWGSQLNKPWLFLAATDTVHVNIAVIINCNCIMYIYIYIYLFSCTWLDIELLLLHKKHLLTWTSKQVCIIRAKILCVFNACHKNKIYCFIAWINSLVFACFGLTDCKLHTNISGIRFNWYVKLFYFIDNYILVSKSSIIFLYTSKARM